MNKLFIKSLEISAAMFDPNYPLRCQHFSFVYHKNRLISIGRNNAKTHPINLRNPRIARDGSNVSHIKTTCSELNAILKLKRTSNINFGYCNMINIRLDKNRDIGNSCPCNSCSSLLSYHAFKSVFFTDESGGFVKYEQIY